MIRNARRDDATAACQVLRRSIAELCVADHGNDPAILGGWLANKTPEMFAAWMVDPSSSLLVAVEGDTIVAVGQVTDTGHIMLNYVLPDVRFRGFSRAMLVALEQRAVERGAGKYTLTSTMTAQRFYRANGYVEDGRPAATGRALSGLPMRKAIAQKLA